MSHYLALSLLWSIVWFFAGVGFGWVGRGCWNRHTRNPSREERT